MSPWRYPTITSWSFKAAAFCCRSSAAFLLLASAAWAQSVSNDPHYTPGGFFDIHVCHWPNRPLFFMALFSTTQFDEVQSVQVRDPKGRLLGNLDMERFDTFKTPLDVEKRVFISHFDVPKNARNGWYQAIIKMRDGKIYKARDMVRVTRMDMPSGLMPADQSRLTEAPTTLRWNAIPGANFYQVSIRDVWQDGKRIFKSKLLTEPMVILPAGLLQQGGSYTWRVHARDTNEHPILGDFNHGVMGPYAAFVIEAE